MERAREDFPKLNFMEAAGKRKELEESAARARAESAAFDPEKAAKPAGTFGDFEIEDKIRQMEEQKRIEALRQKIQKLPDPENDTTWEKARQDAEKRIALADNPDGIEPAESAIPELPPDEFFEVEGEDEIEKAA